MAGLSKVKGSGLATGAATASLVGIDDNATSTAITIDASENVGIGTLSPNYKLKIVGGADILNLENTSASSYEHLRFTVGSANARIIMTGESFGDANYGQGDLTLQTETSGGKIRFGTGASGVNKMIIGDDGISFNGDTAAANALDDYEEGTWTPTLTFNGSSTGITYEASYSTGWYTKVGNLVTMGCHLILSNKGSATGGAQINGLPFSTPDVTWKQVGVLFFPVGVTYTGQHEAYTPRNQDKVTLRQMTEGGTSSNITDTNINSASQFGLIVTLVTDS
jgi:hypothetical protein